MTVGGRVVWWNESGCGEGFGENLARVGVCCPCDGRAIQPRTTSSKEGNYLLMIGQVGMAKDTDRVEDAVAW
jgi:hypothetical protein